MVILSNLVRLNIMVNVVLQSIQVQLLDQQRLPILDLLHQGQRLLELVFPDALHELLEVDFVFVLLVLFGDFFDILNHRFVPCLPIQPQQLHLLIALFVLTLVATPIVFDSLSDVGVSDLGHVLTYLQSDAVPVLDRLEVFTLLGKDALWVFEGGESA